MVKLYNDFLSVSGPPPQGSADGGTGVSMAGNVPTTGTDGGEYVESDRFKFSSATDSNVKVKVSRPSAGGPATVEIGVYYV